MMLRNGWTSSLLICGWLDDWIQPLQLIVLVDGASTTRALRLIQHTVHRPFLGRIEVTSHKRRIGHEPTSASPDCLGSQWYV